MAPQGCAETTVRQPERVLDQQRSVAVADQVEARVGLPGQHGVYERAQAAVFPAGPDPVGADAREAEESCLIRVALSQRKRSSHSALKPSAEALGARELRSLEVGLVVDRHDWTGHVPLAQILPQAGVSANASLGVVLARSVEALHEETQRAGRRPRSDRPVGLGESVGGGAPVAKEALDWRERASVFGERHVSASLPRAELPLAFGTAEGLHDPVSAWLRVAEGEGAESEAAEERAEDR